MMRWKFDWKSSCWSRESNRLVCQSNRPSILTLLDRKFVLISRAIVDGRDALMEFILIFI